MDTTTASRPSFMATRATPRTLRRRRAANRLMLGLSGLATLSALVPLAWILISILSRGLPALTPAFFIETFKPVSEGGGGVAHAIIGTFEVVGLASLMAMPIGVLGGLYAADHPNTPIGLAVRFGTDVLAGLPSIVVGLFVHTVMVAGIGYSAISGAVALAIMMLPVVLRSTEEMLKLVPRALYEASAGLGAPVWKTSLQVMLPAALRGVITGALLAVSRVSGETAPLLFTAQGNNVMSTALDQPIATLPLTMFKYASDPDPARNAQAWGIALLIVAIVLGLNILSRAVLSRSRR